MQQRALALTLVLALSGVAACRERAFSVEEAVAQASLLPRPARVHGRVVPASLVRAPASGAGESRFRIADGRASLLVRLAGVAPDTLYEGNEGSFRGTLRTEGGAAVLYADSATLRCGDARARR